MATTPEYTVVLRDFSSPPTSFAPGNIVAVFENQKNLGYAHYVNDVGEMFFTLTNKDSKASSLSALGDKGGNVQIYRNADNVWSGFVGEIDERPKDIIVYGYSYEAELFKRQSSWGQEWLNTQVDTIFTDLWTTARSSTSRLGWASTGTLEVPVTTSGGATPYLLNRYTIYYKRILFAFQELVAAAISDTTNRVVWEITPAGALNLWKNRGTDLALKFIYGDPLIIGYSRWRAPADHRNVIYAVGSTPRDIALRSTQSDGTDINTRGREEESVYMQWVRDQDELDRVAKIRLQRALRKDAQLSFTFSPGALVPFRATGQSYKLTDGVRCVVNNGPTQVDEVKLITGQQVILYRGQEIVRPLLWDRL